MTDLPDSGDYVRATSQYEGEVKTVMIQGEVLLRQSDGTSVIVSVNRYSFEKIDPPEPAYEAGELYRSRLGIDYEWTGRRFQSIENGECFFPGDLTGPMRKLVPEES